MKDRQSTKVHVSELYLLYPGEEPGLSLGLRVPGSPLFFVNVLIYGARPVRYQVEFRQDRFSERSRTLWDLCLGPLSLVSEKSGTRGGKTQLFYEVTYPDAFLKKLGE